MNTTCETTIQCHDCGLHVDDDDMTVYRERNLCSSCISIREDREREAGIIPPTACTLIRTVDDGRQLFASRYAEFTNRAKAHFRDYLPEARDEAVANVLCDTWEQFVSLIERALANDTLLSTTFCFACKRTRSGRNSGKIKSSGYKELFNHAKPQTGLTMDAFVSDRTSVPDVVSFKLDTEQWLDNLPENHRARAIDLASGEAPSNLATRWHVSRAAVTGEKRYLESSYESFMSISE